MNSVTTKMAKATPMTIHNPLLWRQEGLRVPGLFIACSIVITVMERASRATCGVRVHGRHMRTNAFRNPRRGRPADD